MFLLISLAIAAPIDDLGVPGSGDFNGTCAAESGMTTADFVAETNPVGTHGLSACQPGERCLQKVELDMFPKSVCADGTPGVFYVRPGVGELRDNWIVYLQGGGKCTDYDSCQERWCGLQGQYHAGKMSSTWGPDPDQTLLDEASSGGIFSQNPDNDFRDWTHVFAYYCSSDSWLGRASDVVYENDLGDELSVDARGHTILANTRKLLRHNGPPVSNWLPTGLDTTTCSSATSDTCMPSLSNAEQIVFAGTSAGALGAVQNADWFLAPFSSARTGLVLDGNIGIPDNVLDDEGIFYRPDGGWAHASLSSFNAAKRVEKWAPGGDLEVINAFIDESCPDGESCTQVNQLLHRRVGLFQRSYVSTDTFVRFDMEDSVISKRFVDPVNADGVIIELANGTKTDLGDFRNVVHSSLRRFYNHGFALDLGVVSGLFAPACRTHVGLRKDTPFRNHLTTETGGTPPAELESDFHDVLSAWWNTNGVAVLPLRYLDDPVKADGYSSCSGIVNP